MSISPFPLLFFSNSRSRYPFFFPMLTVYVPIYEYAISSVHVHYSCLIITLSTPIPPPPLHPYHITTLSPSTSITPVSPPPSPPLSLLSHHHPLRPYHSCLTTTLSTPITPVQPPPSPSLSLLTTTLLSSLLSHHHPLILHPYHSCPTTILSTLPFQYYLPPS